MHDPTLWLALASAAFYAFALVLAQRGLRHRSALEGATISLPTTAVALWLLAAVVPYPHPVIWHAVAVFAAIGVLFPVGVTLLSYEANRHLGPTLAGALGNVTPLVAVAFATLVLGERLTPLRAAGMLVVLAGVVLLSLRRKLAVRDWPLWALALPLAAAVIRGIAQPAMKLGLGVWPAPFAATMVSYTVSAAVILVIAAVGARRRAPVPRASGGALLFAGVGLCNGGVGAAALHGAQCWPGHRGCPAGCDLSAVHAAVQCNPAAQRALPPPPPRGRRADRRRCRHRPGELTGGHQTVA